MGNSGKKSISSRRGGGGSGGNDTTITWWKCLFLASLILLVSFLVRLNYQLVKELSVDRRPAKAKTGSVGGDSPAGDAVAAQKRLKSLRKQLSSMRGKVGAMKDMVEDLKRRNAGGAGNHESPGEYNQYNLLNGKGQLDRITCTPEVARTQRNRMNKRFNEWWSHSACPDQVWMENIAKIFQTASASSSGAKPYVVLDIGCNKGYTSADFLDALSPGTNINPRSLVNAIRTIAREMNTKFDRDGGVCNDSNKALNKDRKVERNIEVHCFEPSPATFNMLVKARSKLMPRGVNILDQKAMWHIHNVGLHNKNGQMSWHSVCASAVGDELCTIVPDGTEGAVSVPVVTVDKFLRDTYPDEASPLVHMLKIDAEGLDPAVLEGSTKLLTENRAVMVMFEFNPGLSEKDPPHGMWGKRGNPRANLLAVTRWLDDLGYDCYLDTRLIDEHERKKSKGVLEAAPGLYRITGDCLPEEPRVRGWANVICAARKFPEAALTLRHLATMV